MEKKKTLTSRQFGKKELLTCVKNHESGITLVALAITIIVLIIITGVAVSTGVESIRNSKKTSFTTELEMIQQKVDIIYEQRRLNKEDITFYDVLGQDVSVLGNEKLSSLLNGNSGEGYRYFAKEDLNKLDLENIEQDVIINFTSRDVASVTGLLIDGKMCYRLADIPSYQGQNIEYTNKNIHAPTFEVNITRLSETWQVALKNVNNQNQVYGGELRYKLQGDENWILVGERAYFEVSKPRNI